MAKRTIEIVKLVPEARSIRSVSLGWCTLLFDVDFEDQFRAAKFNPLVVAKLEKPKKAFQTVCKWASEGMWCAIESHPEIVDGDGVPGLDLIFDKDPGIPDVGSWTLVGVQLLNLPSGRLKIVYEPEFFEDWYQDEFPTYDFTDRKLESFKNGEYLDATSYLLNVEPGSYSIHAYVADFADDSRDGRHADLAIFLNLIRKKGKESSHPLIRYPG